MKKFKSLATDLANLRKFVKNTSKKHPDKVVRGFTDGIIIINEFLDDIEEIISFIDDKGLAFFRRMKQEMDEKTANIRQRLAKDGHRDENGQWIPASFTDDEIDHIIFVMFAKVREKNLKTWDELQPHRHKMSKTEKEQLDNNQKKGQ